MTYARLKIKKLRAKSDLYKLENYFIQLLTHFHALLSGVFTLCHVLHPGDNTQTKEVVREASNVSLIVYTEPF